MRNTNNTYKTQGGDNLVITVKENAPLLEYLINNVSESRSKLKATLQGRGIAVNGRMVTQFDYQLKAGDKIIISRHKKQNQFKSRYVKIVYEDRWLVVVEKNIGILSMARQRASKLPRALSAYSVSSTHAVVRNSSAANIIGIILFMFLCLLRGCDYSFTVRNLLTMPMTSACVYVCCLRLFTFV